MMFDEELITMDKHAQIIAGQTIVTWSEGTEIVAKMQISNMPETLIAQAQGVIPTGYLVVDTQYEPLLTLNTHLKYEKGGFYVRITDVGIDEAGERFFDNRQFAVEVVQTLPR